jgi:hypothetical protein
MLIGRSNGTRNGVGDGARKWKGRPGFPPSKWIGRAALEPLVGGRNYIWLIRVV